MKTFLIFSLIIGTSFGIINQSFPHRPGKCRGTFKMFERSNGRFYKEIANVGHNTPDDFTSAKNSVAVIPSLNKLTKGRFFIKVTGDCCWKVYQRYILKLYTKLQILIIFNSFQTLFPRKGQKHGTDCQGQAFFLSSFCQSLHGTKMLVLSKLPGVPTSFG